MTDAAAEIDKTPGKSGKKPLILAVVLALIGGGGGFYTVTAGLIPFGKQPAMDDHDAPNSEAHNETDAHGEPASHGAGSVAMESTAFVPVDPLLISLSDSQSVRHLRFRAELEVDSEFEKEVSAVLPRVTDVLNSYLRALELDDLTGPLALVRLRGQMLRRIQVVTGKGRVKDLLIMEFVLN